MPFRCNCKIKSTQSVGLTISLIIYTISLLALFEANLISVFADQENRDEAEIIYAEAHIAVNSGDCERGLALGKKALGIDSFHYATAELAYECAKKLNRKKLQEELRPILTAAKEKDRVLKLATQQLELAVKDLSEDRTKDSISRFSYVENLSISKQSDIRELAEEARFRRGLLHLEQQDVREAFSALLNAGRTYRQRAKYVIGNYLYQQGYVAQAYTAYKKSSDTTIGERDQEIGRASQAVMNKIDSFTFDLRGNFLTTSDNNPFGLPPSISTYRDSSNRSLAGFAGINGSIATPVNDSNRILFRGLFGLNQSYSFSRDYRQTLDAQTISSGISAYMASFGVGRVNIRYFYQLSRSPTEISTSVFENRATLRSHGLNFDISRELSRRLDFRFGYRGTWARYLTPGDVGFYDRSNLSHGIWVGTLIRTKTRFFKPTFTLGGDYINAAGNQNSNRLAYASIYNYMPLGTRWEAELSASLEHADYFRFSADRVDINYRGAFSLNYWLSSKFTVLIQGTYSHTKSTLDYYSQNRITGSFGFSTNFL